MSFVREETREGVRWLVLSLPERRNAVTGQRLEEMVAALRRAWSDDAVGAVVLTGDGPAFCAGGDRKEMAARRPDAPAIRRHIEGIQQVVVELLTGPKIVVAGLNGPAVGAGVDLALACDLRLAAPSASFRCAYVDLGLIPGAGGAMLLPRLIGRARAAAWLIDPRTVAASELASLGLVEEVAADGSLPARLQERAARIAARPRLALRLLKQQLNADVRGGFLGAMDATASHVAVLEVTPEHRRLAGADE